ncbi:DNA repair protein [Prauserella marina]|uniref:Alkylated DNA repair dioxygenase AlkB n=1 Tax=Prauserella marina TaxID=530584 RepID=A0A222VSA7_9PSEU|nr:alpha-ketoglutarate-dependent dioxygenase AlkB [Prauserella marina]ASR36789.1 DNA repair protein [Prauserella marina]PWV80311.1 DNA-N1-methyladenine dioxygenase [Prauserella marina]SDD51538.1 Alkylated DNA repair dioxygenase AlkB [Prauserella marina]
MSPALQGSLFAATEETALRSLDLVRRERLDAGAWIDVLPGWLTGADSLFERLVSAVPWRAERRQMYDRTVDVPRLLSFYEEEDSLPEPVLDDARAALTEHYGAELGEPFRTAGLCFYRDGRDSVAWHGDTIGRGSTEDTMVAILSVGAPRALLLRPRARPADRGTSGPPVAGTVRHTLGHGDLIVMGGACQRTWEHAIPKSGKPVGPRISIQFRPRGVR